ncbi:MAG: UDP-N-acetylglucosamine 2-epimerase (non-hydrolyzing), partial [candidate division Zixibacteria bacterium]|nr:UDP-N-acetylglucosamine 2-epimerase (non-hydrolyzing) [candidate division Zixibacteria bacterium]
YSVLYTGNTVVDAIEQLLDSNPRLNEAYTNSTTGTRRILVTAHRRENWGEPMEQICRALRAIAEEQWDTEIVFPVHRNPRVRETVFGMLDNVPGIRLIDPLAYTDMIEAMAASTLILTDSGGIQEEAPTLHKPVIVLRNETERPEAVEAGGAVLAGPDFDRIVSYTREILTDNQKYTAMASVKNPFGDGLAACRIVEALRRHFELGVVSATQPLEEYYA